VRIDTLTQELDAKAAHLKERQAKGCEMEIEKVKETLAGRVKKAKADAGKVRIRVCVYV
jgi:hypothetical protein